MIKVAVDECGAIFRASIKLLTNPRGSFHEVDGRIECCGVNAYSYYVLILIIELFIQMIVSGEGYWNWQAFAVSLFYSLSRIVIQCLLWQLCIFVLLRGRFSVVIDVVLFHTAIFSLPIVVVSALYIGPSGFDNLISGGGNVNSSVSYFILVIFAINVIGYIYLYFYISSVTCFSGGIVVLLIFVASISYLGIRPFTVIPLFEFTKKVLLVRPWGG